MHEQMTVLRPAAHSPDGHGISSAFPPEVLEQVRGRVRLLSVLLLVAFAFDLVVYAGNWLAILVGYPAPSGFFETGAFQVVNVVAVAASAGLWWVARSRRVSATRLHTLGLVIRDHHLFHHRDDHVLAVLRPQSDVAEPHVGPCRHHSVPLDHAGPTQAHARRGHRRRGDGAGGAPSARSYGQGGGGSRRVLPGDRSLRVRRSGLPTRAQSSCTDLDAR